VSQHEGGMLRPEPKYLNVIGGFLAITVERQDGKPVMIARHHGVGGKILNEDRFVAK
jgi:hypothetical protein